MRPTAILFFVGAVLGTALDHLHVASGTTSYAQPFLWQQAAWVPLLFGLAAAGFADLHARLRGLFRAPPRSSPALALVDFLVFVAAYWASAYLPWSNEALLALFAGAFLLRIAVLRDPPHRVAHGLLCALLGVTTEWALTRIGVFTHHRADLLRVPFWLPGLYLLASPVLADLDELLSFQIVADTNKAPEAVVSPAKGGTS